MVNATSTYIDHSFIAHSETSTSFQLEIDLYSTYAIQYSKLIINYVAAGVSSKIYTYSNIPFSSSSSTTNGTFTLHSWLYNQAGLTASLAGNTQHAYYLPTLVINYDQSIFYQTLTKNTFPNDTIIVTLTVPTQALLTSITVSGVVFITTDLNIDSTQ